MTRTGLLVRKRPTLPPSLVIYDEDNTGEKLYNTHSRFCTAPLVMLLPYSASPHLPPQQHHTRSRVIADPLPYKLRYLLGLTRMTYYVVKKKGTFDRSGSGGWQTIFDGVPRIRLLFAKHNKNQALPGIIASAQSGLPMVQLLVKRTTAGPLGALDPVEIS